MKNMFDLITGKKGDKGEPEECRLGIRVHLGGFDTLCAVTPSCRSYKAFETEVRNITKDLGEILKEAERFFDK